MNGTSLQILFCFAADGSGKHKSDQQRFTIKKPWVGILAENKKMWKEQAAKGLSVFLFDKVLSILSVSVIIFFPVDAEQRALQQQLEENSDANKPAPVEEEE